MKLLGAALPEGPWGVVAMPVYLLECHPEGQRFLMLKPVESETSAPTQINIVLNWFEELKRKVPVK